MFSKKLGKYLSKIEGERLQARFAASDRLIAGATIYIILGGVPIDNGIGLDPICVKPRIERIKEGGFENYSLRDFCKLYCSMHPAIKDKDWLDFYEDLNC